MYRAMFGDLVTVRMWEYRVECIALRDVTCDVDGGVRSLPSFKKRSECH